MRLIDADALKEDIANNVYMVADYFNSKDFGMFWTGGIEKIIDEQPTISDLKPHNSWYRMAKGITLKDGSVATIYRTVFETSDYETSEKSVDWCRSQMEEK